MSVEKEILDLLRDTYLFFTIPDTLEGISEELLIQVYLRLLVVLDPNYELQDSTSTEVPVSAATLKHIHKSLRHLELVHLVNKASHLLDKKVFARLCSALHDKITARYGTKFSIRVRKVVKAQDLSRRKKKRTEKEELRTDEKGEAKENFAPPKATANVAGLGKAATKRRVGKNESPVPKPEELEMDAKFVAPLKGRELARTPVRPQKSDASTCDSSCSDSPNVSVRDSEPVPESPLPAGQILPPPLDYNDDPVTNVGTDDLPLTPSTEILAVNQNCASNTTVPHAAAVNVIPSGRQIARTPVGSKLSGDVEDETDHSREKDSEFKVEDVMEGEMSGDLEGKTDDSELNGEEDVTEGELPGDVKDDTDLPREKDSEFKSEDVTEGELSENVEHETDAPGLKCENDAMESARSPQPLLKNTDACSDSTVDMCKDLIDVILEPPPGFDSPLEVCEPALSSSSDGSEEKSPPASKTKAVVGQNDATYVANKNYTFCVSTPMCRTPERLPVLERKNVRNNKSRVVSVSPNVPTKIDGTFVVDACNPENETYIVDPENLASRDFSYKFPSSFDDSDSIFAAAKPLKKYGRKACPKEELSDPSDEDDPRIMQSNKAIKVKGDKCVETIDETEPVVQKRVRKAGPASNKAKVLPKANLPFPENETDAPETVSLANKRKGKKKQQAVSSDKSTTPVKVKEVQTISSSSLAARPKRLRNTRAVNYCEMSVLESPADTKLESASKKLQINTNRSENDDLTKDSASPESEVNVAEPPNVLGTEADTVKRKGRKQVEAETDELAQGFTRASRPKTKPQITATGEHVPENKPAKARRGKVKNEVTQDYRDEVLVSGDSGSTPEEPKVGRRRGRKPRNDVAEAVEAPVFVHEKLEKKKALDRETDCEPNTNQPAESEEHKAKNVKKPVMLSPVEPAKQKAKGNRGRNKKVLDSDTKKDENEAEFPSPVSNVGSPKNTRSKMKLQTETVAPIKKVTPGKNAAQDDIDDDASMDHSPPKRMRTSKSSNSNGSEHGDKLTTRARKPKVNQPPRDDDQPPQDDDQPPQDDIDDASMDSSPPKRTRTFKSSNSNRSEPEKPAASGPKPKVIKPKRAQSPAIEQNPRAKRNIKSRNELETPAVEEHQRPLSTRASKRNVKANIATETKDKTLPKRKR